MPLSDEAPFTPQESEEVLDLVQTVFGPIQQYSTLVNSVAVSPAVFLQLPVYQERLQCLIDSFAVIHDLLPEPVFCQWMDAMLDCRDALSMAEQHAPLSSDPNATPLFGELQWEDGPSGPRLSIPRELVETLIYDVNLTNKEIANILRCSLRTLQRRLDEWQLHRRESTLSDEELYGLIYNYKTTVGMFFGERAIFGLLTAQHHWAPRWKIRQIIQKIDPMGLETRWKRAILRRTYSVPFPNSLWHIDGHHKLIRWKIVTHGGIDGKSRLVVYLRASNNNRAETVAAALQEATAKYGWPSRVRADWGGENVIVQEMMEAARGPGRGSFLAGASTHNQRIERLWRDVFTWTIQAFYTLFTAMETQGILNLDEPVHLWALHLVFLPRINHALGIFVETWNNHKLSTAQNRSPSELWLRGLADARQRGFNLNLMPIGTNPLDDRESDVQVHSPDFTLYGADFRGAQRERRPSDPHVQVEPPMPPFTLDDNQWNQLDVVLSQIDEADDFWGFAKYLAVLQFVAHHLKFE